MRTLFFLFERDCAWSPNDWFTQNAGKQALGRLVIEDETGWISGWRDDRVLDDYCDDERLVLSEMLVNPAVFLIEWRGDRLVESLIRWIPADVPVLVDNDSGLLVRVAAIRDRPLASWVDESCLPDEN
jgi:hypothetical protein